MSLSLGELPLKAELNFTNVLMSSLVMQTEEVISEEKKKFIENGPATLEVEISKEEGLYQYVNYYKGLTNEDVVLEEMFTEFFPSLSRRSAFQTIYAVYEHEIRRVCEKIQVRKGGKKLKNFDGSGLIQVNNFAKLRRPGIEKSAEWNVLNDLRVLRNQCVHGNGSAFKGKKSVKK